MVTDIILVAEKMNAIVIILLVFAVALFLVKAILPLEKEMTSNKKSQRAWKKILLEPHDKWLFKLVYITWSQANESKKEYND